MTIGIITIHNSTNYGACLQSWGLYKFLVDNGFNCEIIDLHRPVHSDYVYSNRYTDYRGLSIKKHRQSLKDWIYKHIYDPNKIPTARIKKFCEFNDQIKLSKRYCSIDELYANPPLYDVYITGSDQLWNPTQPFCIEPYFLTFVKNGGKKISYAASIGINELTDCEKKDFKKWLETYDYISVREMQAKTLLETFIEKPIHQVADPTFLLGSDYWRSIAIHPNITKPYILVFKLYKGNALVDYAARIGKEAGKKVIVLPMGRKTNRCKVVKDAGPLEFLGYMAHADLVITDSFHATVFAIIMGAKNFFSYISPTNKRGSRITTLLSNFNVPDHIIAQDLSTTYTDMVQKPIDVNAIYEIAKQQQQKSGTYLMNSIKNLQ